jgi:hypothetical protein
VNQRQGNEDSAKPGMSESILMSWIGTKVTLLSQGRKKEARQRLSRIGKILKPQPNKDRDQNQEKENRISRIEGRSST